MGHAYVALPEELVDRASRYAKEKGITVEELVEQAVELYLKLGEGSGCPKLVKPWEALLPEVF